MFYLIRGVNGKKVGVIFSMLWIVIHKRDVSKLVPTFITNDMAFSLDAEEHCWSRTTCKRDSAHC